MVEWVCPHCGLKFYSANESGDKSLVECIYCGKEFRNPYYISEPKTLFD